MLHAAVVTEQRRHARVQLNLPVRFRWLGGLGPVVEVTETLDVSRGGLLFCRSEPTQVNAKVWVTFPYQRNASTAQPETPARVVRVKNTPPSGHLVAVEFEVARRCPPPVVALERRGSERFPLALPIRVRPAGTPWPEEAMTIDVSEGGVLFRTTRLYAAGDTVHVALPYGRWAPAGEVLARVVRVESVPGEVELHVALAFLPPAQPS